MATLKELFKEAKTKFAKAEIDLPKELSIQAKKFFNDNFLKEGWYNGNNFEKWKTPQKKLYKGNDPKLKRRSTTNTLVLTGELRRELQSENLIHDVNKGGFILSINTNKIPYAADHNYGLNGMPKRPFLYTNKVLSEMQIKLIEDYIQKNQVI